ncbi:MAG: hypothetical protein WCG98_00660 [bacterium]
MKKFLVVVFIWMLFTVWTSAHAYTPSTNILLMTQTLKSQLNAITSGNYKDKWDYYAQIKALMSQFSGDESLTYVLKELSSSLYLPILTEKVKVKQTSKQFKQNFVATYMT